MELTQIATSDSKRLAKYTCEINAVEHTVWVINNRCAKVYKGKSKEAVAVVWLDKETLEQGLKAYADTLS